jgi:hypothetical protein
MTFGRGRRVSALRSRAALAALPFVCRQALRSFTQGPRVLSGIALAALIASGGCHSSSSTSTGPSPVKCQVSLTASAPTLAAGGATGAVTVSTQPECAWTATAEASWISGLSPDSGQGSGQVAFQAAANPLPTARQGEIVVNNNRVSIRQDGATCAFQIAPLDQSVPSAGGTGRITVTGTAGCAWTAVANEQWLSITSGASGSGGGTRGPERSRLPAVPSR